MLLILLGKIDGTEFAYFPNRTDALSQSDKIAHTTTQIRASAKQWLFGAPESSVCAYSPQPKNV